jgi:hypothetical protein
MRARGGVPLSVAAAEQWNVSLGWQGAGMVDTGRRSRRCRGHCSAKIERGDYADQQAALEKMQEEAGINGFVAITHWFSEASTEPC